MPDQNRHGLQLNQNNQSLRHEPLVVTIFAFAHLNQNHQSDTYTTNFALRQNYANHYLLVPIPDKLIHTTCNPNRHNHSLEWYCQTGLNQPFQEPAPWEIHGYRKPRQPTARIDNQPSGQETP